MTTRIVPTELAEIRRLLWIQSFVLTCSVAWYNVIWLLQHSTRHQIQNWEAACFPDHVRKNMTVNKMCWKGFVFLSVICKFNWRPFHLGWLAYSNGLDMVRGPVVLQLPEEACWVRDDRWLKTEIVMPYVILLLSNDLEKTSRILNGMFPGIINSTSSHF